MPDETSIEENTDLRAATYRSSAQQTQPVHELSIQDDASPLGPLGVCACQEWADSDRDGSVRAIADRWGKHWLHAISTERSASTSRVTPAI